MTDRFARPPGRWDDLIVLWGNSAWDAHRLGAQFLAEALAEQTPVLYVDPPLSLAAAARSGAAGVRNAIESPRLSLIAPGLARLSPLAPPGKTRPGVRSVTQVWLTRAIRRAVDTLGGSVRAVISGYLYAYPFGYCGERWRVFRVSDDFSVGAELGIPVRLMERAQMRLAAAADAVVCVSPTLVGKWRALGYDPVLVPNGCDANRLRNARDLDRPTDIDLPSPIVGYTGQLSRRIDVDLLRGVADRGYSILLVGGTRPDLDPRSVRDLLDRPNVQSVGPRPYADVPSYLGAMDVAVLPYADTAFNRASFPLKLLEYLGAGLPTVSTDLPSVRWLDTDLVRVADDRSTFVAAVTDALRTRNDPGERRRRLDFAAAHSWSSRAADYLALFDRLDRQTVS